MTFIQGGTTLTNAEVLTKGVGNALVVTNPAAVDTGFVALACESDPGAVLGTAKRVTPEASVDYRLRVGQDSILDQEIFNNANQNTGKHGYLNTTLTLSLASAGLVTNASSITTLSTGAFFRTQRMFAIGGQQTPLYFETLFSLSATSMATNSTIDFGGFLPNTVTTAPLDGAYFRITSAGLFGVVNNNGTETVGTALTFTFAANRIYQFVVVYTGREAQFWIDDVLYSSVLCPGTLPSLVQSGSLPWAVQHRIGGTAAGSVVQGKVWAYSVYLGDINQGKMWGHVCSAMGGGLQVQQGATVGGQLTTYALGAAPTASTLTASTAPAITTQGGKWNATIPAAAAESDFPMFAWQNPAGTVAIPGKLFYCTGIRIGETAVTTILGGPMILEWGIGFGSTTSSLVTTEQTSFGGATNKIARKLHLGSQGLLNAAAVGSIAPGFQVDFSHAPLVVNPGEFLHVIMRSVAATATGACRGGVAVLGYFE